MPFKLVAPKAGRSPFYRVRGSEFGISIDRSTKTGDRKIAVKFLAEWRVQAQRDAISGRERKAELTFASAALAYMRAGGEARFLAPLLRHFGGIPLADLSQPEIDAASVALYPRATPATRNRQVYSPVSAVLKHAGVEKPLKRPKGARSVPRLHWLRPEEAFALMASATSLNARFGALITFLLYCGPRLSEALRLEWQDVDLMEGTAFLRRTKNGSPIALHLPPFVVSALANIQADNGRVFQLTKCGRLYALMAQAEKASGVDLPQGIAFHILRHSHATWRRRETGADTSALVGTGLWRSREAAGVYEHLDPSEESKKSNLLPTPTRAKGGRK